jgi:hypothetical protein
VARRVRNFENPLLLKGASWGMKTAVQCLKTPTSGTIVCKYQPTSFVRPSAGNALPLAQMSEKGLDIRSRSILQTLLRQETDRGLRPSNIEWRTIGAYPVLLYTNTVCFPKSTVLVATAIIHALNHERPSFSADYTTSTLLVLDGITLSRYAFPSNICYP